MKTRLIAYWITTALIAFVFLSGGVVDIIRRVPAIGGMRHLGYPDYFMVILGVWKVLGGFVVLAPGLPRPKEWGLRRHDLRSHRCDGVAYVSRGSRD